MSSLVFPPVDVATPSGLKAGPFAQPDDEASSESSSIGSPSSSSSDDDRGPDDQDEAESKSTKESSSSSSGSSSLTSLGSLEDSLPIKKGLSNHFIGKSRSFSNLSECAARNASDLAKQENPFNKRRRIQIASRMSYKRRASCSSLMTAVLPPLLSAEHALHETEEEEEEEENDDSDDDDDDDGGKGYNRIKKKAVLKSPRSFPLFDLQYV